MRDLSIAPPIWTPVDRHRLPGPDVVRAVALIGVVVMNFHGYLILRGGPQGADAIDWFFDPWTGPLSTRFAATFVLVAGVGVSLFTRRAVGDPLVVWRRRTTLARRGLVLYLGGRMLDVIWPGTILPFYGAMFVLAAALFTLRSRWVLLVGASAALAGAALRWWNVQQGLDGGDTSWFFRPSVEPLASLVNVVVNGTHPLLPWLAFFCTGIVLGRVLQTSWWRRTTIATGLALFATASLMSAAIPAGPLASPISSTDPWDRGLLYTASALGTSLAAFGVISWLAQRFLGTVPVELLRHAGAMTLTLYVGHALFFNLVVDWLGWVRPTGLDAALTFSALFWVIAIAFAAWYHRRFGIGPVEWVYRTLGG